MAFSDFQHVKKVYRSGEVEVEALHDVSFQVERGEICVIVGPSGAGKTTLLNILGGMDTLTDGRVTLEDEEISAYSKRRLITYRRRDVGFVFQFYNLIENLTALENVELAAWVSAWATSPPSSPAASSSAWPSPGRWPRTPSSSCATNQPAPWTTPPASRSSSCWRTPAGRAA